MTSPICLRCRLGKSRIAARSCGDSSIRNVLFEIATEYFHPTGAPIARDLLLGAPNESIQFFFCHAVLVQRIIIGVNCNRPQRDDLIAMQDADVFAFGRAFQKRRQIRASLSGRERCHTSILRRYGEQLKCRHVISSTPKKVPAYEGAKLASDFDPQNRDENIDYYIAKLDDLMKRFTTLVPPPAQKQLL